MYSDDYIQIVLHELLASPSENEVIEFKEAKSSFSKNDIGEYFSALANEANLKRREFAWLVFGVANKGHTVVGTNFYPEKNSLHNLKKEIADSTNGRITFIEIYEVLIDGKRVILFQIPAAPIGIPINWKGHYYGRDHESLVPLNIEEIERIRNQINSIRFEREVALANCTFQEVEKLIMIDRIFNDLNLTKPEATSAIVARLISESILDKSSNVTKASITNLGALLYAHDLANFPNLRNKAVRVIVYEGKNKLKTIKQKEEVSGYASGFQELVNYINDQLPQREVIGSAKRETIRMYPELAIRELVANALIHQDFFQSGTSPRVEIFSDRVEITNSGTPLLDTNRFLDATPISRNEDIARFMRRIGLCEELGSGIDKVLSQVEEAHLPAPYFNSRLNHMVVTLYSHKDIGQLSQSERIWTCYWHACLLWSMQGEKLTNESLRARFQLGYESNTLCWRIIKATVKAELIREDDPDSGSRKYARYVPFWA